jgi:hypothetical protein
MTQETYRFAFEEANAELGDILAQFEQLRLRKTQMEQVVEALRPLLFDTPVTATAVTVAAVPIELELAEAEPVPFLVQQTAEPVEVPVLQQTAEAIAEPEYAEQSSDPFQRRIDNALRQGFGGRDSRVLSLGLNGLLTRA